MFASTSTLRILVPSIIGNGWFRWVTIALDLWLTPSINRSLRAIGCLWSVVSDCLLAIVSDHWRVLGGPVTSC